MQNDKVIHECYNRYHHLEEGARLIDTESQFNVYSVRVTYIGLAAAIAIYDGYFKLDEKLKCLLKRYNENILGDTTIKHLLTRSTGLLFQEDSVERVAEPGMNDNKKRPDLVAEIIYHQTGLTVSEIINEKIIEQLGWSKTEWVTVGKENLVCDIYGPGEPPSLRIESNRGDDRNLYVSTRDLVFWGHLHLNKGRIGGKQILPEKIFDLVVTPQSPQTVPSYHPKFGFFWWINGSSENITWEYNELGDNLPEGSFQILGASGCVCLVIPKYNVVAVRMLNSLYDNDFDYLEDIKTFGNMVMENINQ
ncbi:serine hydrolase domain-containing protein [Corticicoccus populi]|uniref:Serine hydrolase domain-containing protein n=1 Tax=Corticicoccus populi TaxID=1812821 RepID=A0ABW5WVR2_9STAP